MRDRFSGLLFACLSVSCTTIVRDDVRTEKVGTRSDAIIAGRESSADQDAVVLLYLSTKNQTCTATMVAPNLLVTARHCVGEANDEGLVTDYAASELHVFTGSGALATLRADDARPATRGKSLVVPPSRSFYPDIAFVVLEDSLDTPFASIRLSRGVGVGEELGVIGFGVDETGERPDTRMQRSGLVVSQIGPGRSGIGEPIRRGELVFGEAACSGDSGGPAFSVETGALVAIASRVGNGTEPSVDSPAQFCIGDETDDIYTDFAPVADVATSAFAAAGASPIIESSVSSAKKGELASAKLDPSAAGETANGAATDVTGTGCHAAKVAGSSPSSLAWLVVAYVVSRRARSSRAR